MLNYQRVCQPLSTSRIQLQFVPEVWRTRRLKRGEFQSFGYVFSLQSLCSRHHEIGAGIVFLKTQWIMYHVFLRFKVMFHLDATYLLYLSGSSETLPGSTWFGDELTAVTFSSEAHFAPNSDKNFTFNEFLAAWWYLSLTLATAEKMDPKDQSSGNNPTGDSGSFMDHVLWNLCIMGAVNMEK